MSLANPEAFTKKHAPGDLGAADEDLRQELRGRKVRVPPSSAWSTMAEVFEQFRRRKEEQAKKSEAAQSRVWKLFNDGCTGDLVEEPLQQGQERQKAIIRLQKNLASNVFRDVWGADCRAVAGHDIAGSQRFENCPLHPCKKNAPCPLDPPIVAVLAGRILRRWGSSPATRQGLLTNEPKGTEKVTLWHSATL